MPTVTELETELAGLMEAKARARAEVIRILAAISDLRLALARSHYGTPGCRIAFHRFGNTVHGTVLGFEPDYIETSMICAVEIEGQSVDKLVVHISDPSLVVSHD